MKKLNCLTLLLALCLTFMSCAASDKSGNDESDTSADTTENTVSTSAETTQKSSTIQMGEPNIYPSVWHSMNAAVVTWGEQNGNSTIKYEGVEVTYDEVFSETMNTVIGDYYGNDYDYEEELLELGFLYVPASYLDDAADGESFLVFTDCIGITTVTNDDGESEDAPYIVVSVMFSITDGVISVPDDEYTSESLIYAYLTEGNTFMEKNYPDVDIRFEDGMTVEEFGEFIEYLCTEADGLVYP